MSLPDDYIERGAAALDMMFVSLRSRREALQALLDEPDVEVRMEFCRPIAAAILEASGAVEAL